MTYTPSRDFELNGPPPPDGIQAEDWYRSPLARVAYEALSEFGGLLYAMPLGRLADELSLAQTSAEHVGDLTGTCYEVRSEKLPELLYQYVEPYTYIEMQEIVHDMIAHIVDRLNRDYVIIHREYERLQPNWGK